MGNDNLKWVEGFVKRDEEIEGRKIDISIIEKAFDNIVDELKEQYKRNNMDETMILRDDQYIKLDNEYCIEFDFYNEYSGKFELYKRDSIHEGENIKKEFDIVIKNEVNQCRVFIVNNRMEEENSTLLRILNELTVDSVGSIIGNLLEINSVKRV